MTSSRFSPTAPVLFLLAIVVTCVVYWAGLSGPFLLDDPRNLQPVQDWLLGKSRFSEAIANRVASPFGRPLALASLAVNAQLAGFTPFAFKLGNLLIHLACGATLYALLRRVARHDPALSRQANGIALVSAGLWLLHPLNAGTVLYAVQRMAQLSTLFMLMAMLLYLVARDRLARDKPAWAAIALFGGIPLLALAGFLSKENAAVIPVLCVLLEFGCYRSVPRPSAVRLFITIFLLAPAALGLALLSLKWEWISSGYDYRIFNLQERLLTQARVLCDYLASILLPNQSRMGIYTDDFAHSTSLLSPPSTLAAILFLLAMSAMAWRLRARLPMLFIGWGVFLVGHAIESGVLPLELYFEHRNYFPMIGILYAVTGLASATIRRLWPSQPVALRMQMALAAAALAVLAVATHARAHIWSDATRLAESAARSRPHSMRAQLAVVSNATQRGDLLRAEQALEALTRSPDPRTRAQGYLNRINLRCAFHHSAEPDDLTAAVRNAPARITKDEAETFDLLLHNTRTQCIGIENAKLGAAAAAFADKASTQPDTISPKAELRHAAARFHARDRDWTRALQQATLAWQPGMPAAASQVLIQSQLAVGDVAGAERTLREATQRAGAGDAQGLRRLREKVDSAKQ